MILLGSFSAFAGVEEKITEARYKVARAIGTHVELLNDDTRILSISKYGAATIAPDLVREFGRHCINLAFGGSTNLTNSMKHMKVGQMVDAILAHCYELKLNKSWSE